MVGAGSTNSIHTTRHAFAVEIDDTMRLLVVDLRPVHVDLSVCEAAQLELVVDGHLLRVIVELDLAAHQRVRVDTGRV